MLVLLQQKNNLFKITENRFFILIKKRTIYIYVSLYSYIL